MPDRPLQSVIHHLRRAVTCAPGGALSDAQLLDAFVRRRDEAAFELLVWRHAAMVLGVCQRLLQDRHEAEDAFQATFLVFVRKAASISNRDSVGCWLHKVACRVAQRARAQAAKRAHQALPGGDVPDRECADEVLWRDLRPVLEEEVNRLPEKYRRPFVLCYLEGHTNEQAAQELGCPKGTVLSRLVRGRERLRARLSRRGVVLSGALLATTIAARASAAAVPAALVSGTVKAAIPFAAGHAALGLVSARTAALTEGVLNAMCMTKLKIAAAVALLVALTGTGAGLFTTRPSLADPQFVQAGRDQARPDGRLPAAGGRGAPRPEVHGIVKAVDAAKNTITVTLPPTRRDEGGGEQEKTFTLTKDTEVGITVAGGLRGSLRAGKLADVAPGTLVALQLSPDEKTVEAVLASGPTLRGVLKTVDAGKRTVTVGMPGRSVARGEAPQEEEKTFTVSAKAEVGVDDGRGRLFSLKQVPLADLPAGALATLKLSTDLKEVQTLLAEGATVMGPVKAVDAKKRRITLTTRVGRGDEGNEERVIDVEPDADVLIDDGKARRFSVKVGRLEDLPVGAVAAVKLSADQQTATSVRAEGPTVPGWFKAADAGKHTITVVLRRSRDGTADEEKTFDVAKDARIHLADGREGSLSDLKVDENAPPLALRLSLDQAVVQSIMVNRGR